MFTQIKVKNFKSFDDLTVTLADKKGKPFNYVFIYGENGAGKSTVLETIDFLSDSIQMMHANYEIESAIQREKFEYLDFKEFILKYKKNIGDLVESKIMVDTKDDMELDYSFLINQKKLRYLLRFNSECELIEESLYFAFDKRISNVFTFTKGKTKINKLFYTDLSYKNELFDLIMKYWGKQTFLSILHHEIHKANIDYFEMKLNKELFNCIITMMNKLLGNIEGVDKRRTLSVRSRIFKDIDGLGKGAIPKNNISGLEKTQYLISDLFINISSSTNAVFYKTEADGDKLRYELYINKNVAGKSLDIPFDLESRGNKKVLALIPYFVKYYKDQVCILDEMDAGVHDLTFTNLIKTILREVKCDGQLIASCHNTRLINYLDAHKIFMICVDPENGKRTIKSFAEMDSNYRSGKNQERQYLEDYLEKMNEIHLNYELWNNV